ncbi:hypothetical protein VP1G_00441 [Cytospora mali]|uniref:Uncharacterized protein n=1 Tax=Cytospora mali TaxID=578113 RepID=A0A194UMM8_CYTMA|nr:hypothetical protein VP1G_00441 [Valsa mali var. pyri (nom. inval.)]
MADSLVEGADLCLGDVSPGHCSSEESLRTELRQSLQNMRLSESLRIDKLLERQDIPHADIYSVFDEENDRLAEDIEARVYILDSAHPKIRKHRLRCIKRMKTRTILEQKVSNGVVVVIKTSPMSGGNIPDRRDSADTEPGGLDVPPVPHTKEARSLKKQKTPFQREAARFGQRERRKERRLDRKRRQILEDKVDQHGNAVSSRDAHPDGDDNEFPWDLVLLYIAYDAEGNLRARITEEHSAIVKAEGSGQLHNNLTTYLDRKVYEFRSVEDMEAFLQVIRSEIASLRRHQKKISGTETYHRAKLLKVIQEQSQHARGSFQWRQIQDGLRAHAFFQLKVVRHVKAVFPMALKRLDSDYNSIDQRLTELRSVLATKELYDEWRRLGDNVAKFERLLSMVFPLPSTRDDLSRQWEYAQRELKTYENNHPELASVAVIEIDDLLKVKAS